MKVSCEYCGSNKWYSLSELKEKISCKGCNNEIIPGIKSRIHYKLSDTIINNLLSDQVKNSKQYDGNYVVLKTLLHLKSDFRNAGNSFIWSPPLDFTVNQPNNPRKSDFDIVVIQNGKLIIGEAKSSYNLFNKKEIESLTWIGNNLMPDKIIIACMDGDLEQLAEKVRTGLTNQYCEVITYKPSAPWYSFGYLFGMSEKEESGNVE